MLTLFHAPRSRSTRIVWLLEELGADYDIRYVSIRYRDNSGAGPDPANIHPDKKVPALLHDGTLVSESTAVALYLTDLLPAAGLAPAVDHADRGRYLTWMIWTDTEFAPAMFAQMSGVGSSPLAQANHQAAVGRLTDALARGPYLLGDRFSAADVMVGASIRFFRGQLPDSPAIDAYLERISSRPAFGRMLAKDAPTAQAA